MAARTLHTDAQKKLCNRLDAAIRITDAPIEAGCGLGIIWPSGRDNLTHPLVERPVRCNCVADPLPILVCACLPNETIIASQLVCPFERPEVGVFRPIE